MWQIICWFAGIWQRWGIQFTPSACYTRSSKQTLCVGLKVDKTWGNDQEPIQSNSTSCPKQQTGKDTHNEDGTKTKTAQAKSKGDSSFEGQRVFEERGKTESRAYDELLQVKWPKEDEPLILYYTEKLIERSRVCHNYNRSQPSAQKGRENGQKIHVQNKQTHVREAQRPAPSSPSEVFRMLKQTEKRGQRAREDFKTLSAPWYKPQSYTELTTTPGPLP